MVTTIGPMVRRDPNGGWIVAVLHVLGGVIGGAMVGLLAGGIGVAVRSISPFGDEALMWLLIFVIVAAGLRDTFGSARGFGANRQTPQSWAYLLPHRWTSFLHGFDLGLGWSTRIYFASYLVSIVCAMATGSALLGVLLGSLFGIARSSGVILLHKLGEAIPRMTVETMVARRQWIGVANSFVLLMLFLSSIQILMVHGGVTPP